MTAYLSWERNLSKESTKNFFFTCIKYCNYVNNIMLTDPHSFFFPEISMQVRIQTARCGIFTFVISLFMTLKSNRNFSVNQPQFPSCLVWMLLWTFVVNSLTTFVTCLELTSEAKWRYTAYGLRIHKKFPCKGKD